LLKENIQNLKNSNTETIEKYKNNFTDIQKIILEVQENSRKNENMLKSQREIIENLTKELAQKSGNSLIIVKELNEKLLQSGNLITDIKGKLLETEKKLEESNEKLRILENENKILRNQLESTSENKADEITKFNRSLMDLQASLDSKQKELIMIKEAKKYFHENINRI